MISKISTLRTGALLVGAAFALTLASCTKTKLDTDEKKASYTIGQQFGKNLKDQNISLDADALAMALRDVAQNKNQLTQEEMQQALMKMQESANKKAKETAEKNKGEAQSFLEKNKSAQGVKTTASGLQYIIEKEGQGKTPTKNDQVKVHYKGTLTNGEVFDSSYGGEPATFPVAGLIPGWTEALQMIKVGSKVKLFIPPELGYGESGRPKIPPNSVLVFEMELLDIVAAQAAQAPKK
jgi:FKBP-type peptidyl-prolyl cis-trans isomerase FkpA/FKBP-type peptidyl-prolyl cis-trans isomerase FklB